MRFTGAIFCLAAGVCLAQADAPATFHVEAEMVLIPVTVTDSMHRYVLGLEKENFHIFEDEASQVIAHFSAEDAPISVGLLVDTSGSMGSKMETSRQAAAQFLRTLNAADEAFLVEFNDHAELSKPFTHDSKEIEQKLKTAESKGLTALLDAVHLGIEEMKRAKNPRKALLVISDGGDNNSRYRSSDIQDLVREADVQIYAMGVFEPLTSALMTLSERNGPRLLAEAAEQTGGRTLAATNSSELPAIASRIGVELRNQYVLAYYPKNKQRDGKYRHVEIKLIEPEALPPLEARWRLGYYAPAP